MNQDAEQETSQEILQADRQSTMDRQSPMDDPGKEDNPQTEDDQTAMNMSKRDGSRAVDGQEQECNPSNEPSGSANTPGPSYNANYQRIEERIRQLTISSIEQDTEDILEILEEGEIIYPERGSSIFIELLEKTCDLCQSASFEQLIKALHPSYQRSPLCRPGSLLPVLKKQLGYPWIDSEAKAKEHVGMLKVLLPLDADLKTRYFKDYVYHAVHPEQWNPHFVAVLIFLLQEGANPHELIEETTAFCSFLEFASSFQLPDATMPFILEFLKEMFEKWEDLLTDGPCYDILPKVIQSIPLEWFKSECSHLAIIRFFFLTSLRKIIQMSPDLCNGFDDKGRSILHGHLQKVFQIHGQFHQGIVPVVIFYYDPEPDHKPTPRNLGTPIYSHRPVSQSNKEHHSDSNVDASHSKTVDITTSHEPRKENQPDSSLDLLEPTICDTEPFGHKACSEPEIEKKTDRKTDVRGKEISRTVVFYDHEADRRPERDTSIDMLESQICHKVTGTGALVYSHEPVHEPQKEDNANAALRTDAPGSMDNYTLIYSHDPEKELEEADNSDSSSDVSGTENCGTLIYSHEPEKDISDSCIDVSDEENRFTLVYSHTPDKNPKKETKATTSDVLDFLSLAIDSDQTHSLLSQLVTEKNVNVKDENLVTPYSWILLWRDTVMDPLLDVQVQNSVTKKFQEIDHLCRSKGASEEDALEGLEYLRETQSPRLPVERRWDSSHAQMTDRKVAIERYRRIEEKIRGLTVSNLEYCTSRIMEILEEGEILYPTKPPTIVEMLLDRTRVFYQAPSFAKLLQALYPIYHRTMQSAQQQGSGAISSLYSVLGYPLIDSESKARHHIDLLKVMIPLDEDFKTRYLNNFLKETKTWTSPFLNVLTFLVSEGANPHKAVGGEDAFTLFLKRACVQLPHTLMTSVSAFLTEVFAKVVGSDKNGLHKIVKALPLTWFDSSMKHLSPLKTIVLDKFLEVIKMNPEVCDQVDEEGKTLLHLLVGKPFTDCDICCLKEKAIVMYFCEIDHEDHPWHLLQQLITAKNVNSGDHESVTPFSWILLWREFMMDPSLDPETLNLVMKKYEETDRLFKSKGGSEEHAFQGLSILRGTQIAQLLTKLTHSPEISRNLAEKISKEILEEWEREFQVAKERIKDLKEKGSSKYLCSPSMSGNIPSFLREHLDTLNGKLHGISEGILKILIDESNMMEIYEELLDSTKQCKANVKRNYFAVFDMLKWCLDKGACPRKDDIIRISLLTARDCVSSEPLRAAILMMEELIKAYRKQGNSEVIEIYLNPIQEQFKVTEDVRVAAGRVIKAAYGTLRDCVKSNSVINILLYLSSTENDKDEFKESFDWAEVLQEREMTNSSKLNWVNQDTDKDGSDYADSKWRLIQGNGNWLQRNVLHLAVVLYCDEEILECIPEEATNRLIDTRDLHGSTPLHLAYLHHNQIAVGFLEAHGAKAVPDHFGRLPESLVNSSNVDESYRKLCQNVLSEKSSVFNTMKPLLIMPLEECEAIQKEFIKLFGKMAAEAGIMNAQINIGGSVREKLKVGRFDEVDLQVCIHHMWENYASLKFHTYLLNRMSEIEWKDIALRPISAFRPWKFVWEKEGVYCGLGISVDVVPILICNSEKKESERQQLLLADAPGQQDLKFLRWHDFEAKNTLDPTMCRYEWDILDSLPPGCRLGIRITKLLLEAMDQTLDNKNGTFLKNPITSYVVKNSLFWILAGQTPEHIEKKHGNVIGVRYAALHQKLVYQAQQLTWMTEDDLEALAEEGRYWAVAIFDVIQFIAKNYSLTLGSFIIDVITALDSRQYFDILETCETCLERLRPEVFY